MPYCTPPWAESGLETGPNFFSGARKAEILKWWSPAQGSQPGPQLRPTGASATPLLLLFVGVCITEVKLNTFTNEKNKVYL